MKLEIVSGLRYGDLSKKERERFIYFLDSIEREFKVYDPKLYRGNKSDYHFHQGLFKSETVAKLFDQRASSHVFAYLKFKKRYDLYSLEGGFYFPQTSMSSQFTEWISPLGQIEATWERVVAQEKVRYISDSLFKTAFKKYYSILAHSSQINAYDIPSNVHLLKQKNK